jgi:hypothetical protein
VSPDPADVTIGELARGLSRVEREVQAGFAAIRQEISGLSFVPAQVYAADTSAWRDRVQRLERDLSAEAAVRRETEATAQQRAWQAKWSIMIALFGMPISIIGALIIAALK